MLTAILPQVEGWETAEQPQTYWPQNLFEYIDGAAEIYLSYDFQELRVGQYRKTRGAATLTIEIYDMGNPKNAFGIYSAERPGAGRFLPIGVQGYAEEGALNFMTGRYYAKLLCYDCGQETEKVLEEFAAGVTERISERGEFPPILEVFPKEGIVANSEKFILRNFMGYDFFHDGFLADYAVENAEFACFVIEADDPGEAAKMREKYLSFLTRNGSPAERVSFGDHIRDRYSQHIYFGLAGPYLFGVTGIADGSEAIGEKYLAMLARAVQANLPK
jgi:hypothetical protein